MTREKREVPPEVAAAVNAVMTEIKTITKDDENKFGHYDFASTDKFLAATNPLCAKAGLIIIQDEEECSVDIREMEDERGNIKKKAYLIILFSFTLAVKSGVTAQPVFRTIMVPANGAQAFGSAQSYALKQFMRSLFQISTGDKDDADLGPADELPTRGAGRSRQEPKREERKRETPKKDLISNPTASASIRAAIDLAATRDEVSEAIEKNRAVLDTLDDGEAIRAEATAKWKKLPKLEKEAAE